MGYARRAALPLVVLYELQLLPLQLLPLEAKRELTGCAHERERSHLRASARVLAHALKARSKARARSVVTRKQAHKSEGISGVVLVHQRVAHACARVRESNTACTCIPLPVL